MVQIDDAILSLHTWYVVRKTETIMYHTEKRRHTTHKLEILSRSTRLKQHTRWYELGKNVISAIQSHGSENANRRRFPISSGFSEVKPYHRGASHSFLFIISCSACLLRFFYRFRVGARCVLMLPLQVYVTIEFSLICIDVLLEIFEENVVAPNPSNPSNPSCPTSRAYKECASRYATFIVNEFRSTIVKYKDNVRLHHIKEMIQDEDGKTRLAFKGDVRGLLWFSHQKKNMLIDRDLNAALNIRQFLLNGSYKDAIFTRDVKFSKEMENDKVRMVKRESKDMIQKRIAKIQRLKRKNRVMKSRHTEL